MYNRLEAVNYAKTWAYRRNPQYYNFSDLGGDCTNFVSQCIYAGSCSMNYTPIYGWYYVNVNNRAPAWTGVNELYYFLINNQGVGPKGEEVTYREVDIGDIIQFDFTDTNDIFDHTPIVVDRGNNTPDTILLAAHSNDCDCRPMSTYRYAKYRAVHITC